MRIRVHPSFPVWMVVSMVFGCTGTESPTGIAQPEQPAIVYRSTPIETGVIRATFPGGAICGIPAITTETFRSGATWEFLPAGVPSMTAGTLRITWTTADGKSIQVAHSGQTTRTITEWIDSRTFRAVETTIGLAEALKTSHGALLSRDAGRVAIELLVELQDGGGFLLVGPPVFLEISGPHPDGDSNFALFCAIVTEALT